MSNAIYKIIFQGAIVEGQKIEDVKKALAQSFNVQESKIDKFFSGQPYQLKTGLDYETALKYKEKFEKSGALCRIEEIPSENQEEGVRQKDQLNLTQPQEQKVEQPPQKENPSLSPDKSTKGGYSIINYLVSVGVRILFFLYPIPLNSLYQFIEKYQISITQYIPSIVPTNFIPTSLPLGLTILMIGTTLGGILNILFPNHLIGGKIAVKAFNIGTLYWFKGLGFHLEVDATGKGIAVKDQKE